MENIKKINTPIFIIGVGRSGTTLLQSMLNAHHQIAFMAETHFIKNYLAKSRYIKKKYKHKLLADKSLMKLELDLEELIDSNISVNRIDLFNLYKDVLKSYKNKRNAILIGDKDPKNIEYLNTIKKFFPDAYIIHIIRDPRDVVLSRLKAEWSKNRGLLINALTYEFQIIKGKQEGLEMFCDKYYEVSYENLLNDSEKSLQLITKFLSVEYDEKMVNYIGTNKNIIKGEELKWKSNCFKPVIKNNFNKWKQGMSLKEIETVQIICEKSMNLNGYKRTQIQKKHCFKKIILTIIKYLFNRTYNAYINL
jgi:hypothetical protein